MALAVERISTHLLCSIRGLSFILMELNGRKFRLLIQISAEFADRSRNPIWPTFTSIFSQFGAKFDRNSNIIESAFGTGGHCFGFRVKSELPNLVECETIDNRCFSISEHYRDVNILKFDTIPKCSGIRSFEVTITFFGRGSPTFRHRHRAESLS